jgi:hypothetical protein
MNYVTCHHKKSKPKVMVEVCRRCRRAGSCQDYQPYVQPSLFPNFGGPVRSKRKGARGKRLPPIQNRSTQEQLSLRIR